MDELAQFLRDRYDEEATEARAATPGPWEQSGIGDYGWTVSFSRPGAGVETEDSDQGRADAVHIARHDPARVLRDIEAKRRILYLAEQLPKVTASTDMFDNNRDGWAEVVKQLALPYADHPSYRAEWRL